MTMIHHCYYYDKQTPHPSYFAKVNIFFSRKKNIDHTKKSIVDNNYDFLILRIFKKIKLFFISHAQKQLLRPASENPG